jgi:hypothetical protein
MKNAHAYRAYLVRLWPKEREGHVACRATLDAVESGRRYDFAELDDLLNFLRGEEAELTHITDISDPIDKGGTP